MIDTHCHIHDTTLFAGDPHQSLLDARAQGVETIINVGTDAESSKQAVLFSEQHNLYATVAQHPHDAKDFTPEARETIAQLVTHDRVVGVGECGLDYYYGHSTPEEQEESLRWHLQLAKDYNKPLSFHIRDAFDAFWAIYDDYGQLPGVVHSFSATTKELEQALERGLFVAFNGIMTFTKDEQQLKAVEAAPLERILLETDAPFLTPLPLRGKINEPKHIPLIAEKISSIKGVNPQLIRERTTINAKKLFNI